MRLRTGFATAFICIVLVGCSVLPSTVDRNAEIIVVGDSILAWHRGTGRSIPSVLQAQSGLSVSDASVSGATFLGTNGIQSQFTPNEWNWVVVNGGGNDLQPNCGTPDANLILDSLISADGREGAMPSFMTRASANGARVILLGYYPISDRGGPFVPCRAILNELAARQALMAALNPAVTFVDSGLVIRPDNADAYAPDLVHPSPLGARLVGNLIATVITAAN